VLLLPVVRQFVVEGPFARNFEQLGLHICVFSVF
jgi:hypothetical protein